jgi:predicted dehydrogenase
MSGSGVDLPRVALIGANGHGLWHRRRLAPMHATGVIDLVALCDTAPVAPAQDAPIPQSTKVYADHAEMLIDAVPDVVVICTPPHTHLAIARDAVRAGCDLLLEKPPVPDLAEHRALTEAIAASGRACQVGFQALGSAALAELVAAVRGGRLGTVTGIGVAGSWQRPDAYYHRSPWAGRRWLDGRPVLDGALVNPFAHAVMQALAIAAAAGAGALREVAVERFRTRDIETDDTSCLRLRLEGGVEVAVAATLCGEEFIPGDILVRGSAGEAMLEYPTDRLRLPGEAELRDVPGRLGLLENLLEHRARGVPLLAPLERTELFTAVVERIVAVPARPIGAEYLRPAGAGQHAIAGVNAVIRRAATELSLFSELGAAWAD